MEEDERTTNHRLRAVAADFGCDSGGENLLVGRRENRPFPKACETVGALHRLARRGHSRVDCGDFFAAIADLNIPYPRRVCLMSAENNFRFADGKLQGLNKTDLTELGLSSKSGAMGGTNQNTKQRWWETMPAILAGLVALVGAVVGAVRIFSPEPTGDLKAPVYQAYNFLAGSALIPPNRHQNVFIGASGSQFGVTIQGSKNLNQAGDVFIEFVFNETRACRYVLEVEYAALTARPISVSLNEALLASTALELTTGGWEPGHQKRLKQVPEIRTIAGENRLRFHSPEVFPHIKAVYLVPIK